MLQENRVQSQYKFVIKLMHFKIFDTINGFILCFKEKYR